MRHRFGDEIEPLTEEFTNSWLEDSAAVTKQLPVLDSETWDAEATKEAEERGTAVATTVRCVVWRHSTGGEQGVQIVPIERWECLDYLPYELQDFPDEER